MLRLRIGLSAIKQNQRDGIKIMVFCRTSLAQPVEYKFLSPGTEIVVVLCQPLQQNALNNIYEVQEIKLWQFYVRFCNTEH
jgi:hypothetical protein